MIEEVSRGLQSHHDLEAPRNGATPKYTPRRPRLPPISRERQGRHLGHGLTPAPGFLA